jgi:hypothetical protein
MKLFHYTIAMMLSGQAISGETSYNCKIENMYDMPISGGGTLEKSSGGTHFTVSRLSGEIQGNLLTTKFANFTQVINHGSSDYAFMSTAEFDAVGKIFSSGNETSERTKSIQVIRVYEYRQGKTKPFTALSSLGVFSGQCE